MNEASVTGKPIYILPLRGHINSRPKQFIHNLERKGIVRIYQDSIDTWTYDLFNDTLKVATLVRQKMGI